MGNYNDSDIYSKVSVGIPLVTSGHKMGAIKDRDALSIPLVSSIFYGSPDLSLEGTNSNGVILPMVIPGGTLSYKTSYQTDEDDPDLITVPPGTVQVLFAFRFIMEAGIAFDAYNPASLQGDLVLFQKTPSALFVPQSVRKWSVSMIGGGAELSYIASRAVGTLQGTTTPYVLLCNLGGIDSNIAHVHPGSTHMKMLLRASTLPTTRSLTLQVVGNFLKQGYVENPHRYDDCFNNITLNRNEDVYMSGTGAP